MGEMTGKTAASVGSSGSAQLNPPGMGAMVSGRTNTDAAVVSAAASVDIKPSNISQSMQQSRQAVEAAAQQMQTFVDL